MVELGWSLFSIVLIDLALSGDNAAVIGLAIRNLPAGQRKVAAFLGAGGAILLRATLTVLAASLMRVPYLHAIGGAILALITYKLVTGNGEEMEMEKNVRPDGRFWSAIGFIMAADLSMAFDNIVAVAGAARGRVDLVVFGLALSIPLLVLGANWLATLMRRYPIIICLGGAVLAHTSLTMVFTDRGLDLARYLAPVIALLIPWAAASIVFLWGWRQTRRTLVTGVSGRREDRPKSG